MNPIWAILSLVLPTTTALLGIAILLGSSSGTGDYAARLGSGVLLLAGIGLACAFGEIAAIVSLLQGERPPWLAAIGVIANLLVILPIFRLLMSE